MAMIRNYSKELNKLMEALSREDKRPSLLLHACCAPCSSAVLEQLTERFAVSVLYYNPNISPRSEFEKREAELERLIREMPAARDAKMIRADYDPTEFYTAVRGLEDIPEGGERCFVCYRLRLEAAAKYAAEHGFDYFTSTLSISPLKNAAKLNEIGEELAEKYGVPHLPSDFKKKDGYKRSIVLSKEYDLYRQDFCGCVFSKREREMKDGSHT
ncbi:MAG: epoxyqueuosine reductase QueH [Clostridia bacterium]|nr:epoxyqueuosine reductase QueH [Clostridia bacterium]